MTRTLPQALGWGQRLRHRNTYSNGVAILAWWSLSIQTNGYTDSTRSGSKMFYEEQWCGIKEKEWGGRGPVLGMVIGKHLPDLSSVSPKWSKGVNFEDAWGMYADTGKANAQALKQECARLLEEPHFVLVWPTLWSLVLQESQPVWPSCFICAFLYLSTYFKITGLDFYSAPGAIHTPSDKDGIASFLPSLSPTGQGHAPVSSVAVRSYTLKTLKILTNPTAWLISPFHSLGCTDIRFPSWGSSLQQITELNHWKDSWHSLGYAALFLGFNQGKNVIHQEK